MQLYERTLENIIGSLISYIYCIWYPTVYHYIVREWKILIYRKNFTFPLQFFFESSKPFKYFNAQVFYRENEKKWKKSYLQLA